MNATRWVLTAALAGLPLLGCAGGGTATEPAGQLEIHTLTHDGQIRRYALYVPRGKDGTPLPLVFSLHGGGVGLEDQIGIRGHKSPFKLWMGLAEREGFYVVYPEGLPGAYGRPTWNDCRADCTVSSSADDVGFLLALLDAVAAEHPVDRGRVYASGMSNGGFMALRLAVEKPNVFAAVAAIGAAMPAVSSCGAPERAVPVLFMNGTADPNMPYDGGILGNPPQTSHGTVMSTPDSVTPWADLAGARPAAVRRLPDLDPDDGGTVTVSDYIVAGRVWVRLYTVGGSGHAAPSLRERYSALFERYFGHQNHDIEAVEEIWRFFAGVSSDSGPDR
ncbi:alpha/beta hydrolase family esterase [Oceanithermus sp.]